MNSDDPLEKHVDFETIFKVRTDAITALMDANHRNMLDARETAKKWYTVAEHYAEIAELAKQIGDMGLDIAHEISGMTGEVLSAEFDEDVVEDSGDDDSLV